MYFLNSQKQFFLAGLLPVFLALFFGANVVHAEELTSTNYKISESAVTSGGGGFSSSASFQLIGSIAQPAVGTSSDSNSLNAGFLTWPAPTAATEEETETPSTDNGAPLGLLAQFVPLPPTSELPPALLPRPVISAQIATARAAIVAKADLNNDGDVGLQDLSALFSIMSDALPDPKTLSLLFSRWTEPILTFRYDGGSFNAPQYQSFEPKQESGLFFARPQEQTASLGELPVKQEQTREPKPTNTPREQKPGFFGGIKNFVSGIFGHIIDLFRLF